ncbi:Co2+/Mg2+ efflux protein ApaG [Pseudoalteromonas citrea]|uniref:Protein ApaG n=1 Tax=Pseudoalteromonas citrea TaxID=43655 RepID=A0A5S3XWZ6_9GAMM|nr:MULTISPECIES: Co2+/Mg2+ efflux protein ApaG [Pseudoalteromonas]RJE75660.1 Co2+/Mg2+ efflux protein ApaG [Pseudoalteromonas sp. MSK9-3]TMP38528.1 Co2+/Mg2+ efflux protein ApaG [Pseudoalteromonas citrea]TMP62674.1 Co2+/Mg2+ efflux protein ApaG [Pseudoalteromonas citrea]
MTISSNIGSPIKVSVETFYVEAQSQPEKDKYVFAYTVTIKNHSLCSAKLESRYWLITDANGKESEIEGEGVIGEKPSIAPGESYKYTSGAVLDTPLGTMQGHYLMRNEFGTEFEAPIPVFSLKSLTTLH